MKVNMSIINDVAPVVIKPETTEVEIKEIEVETQAVDVEEDVEEDEFDNSDKHSKLKTFLLVAAMVGGLGLFVWNMTGLVNNMRLDNQGSASSIVYERQDLKNAVGGSEGSEINTDATSEGAISTDAARDGPSSEDDSSKNSNVTNSKTNPVNENKDTATLQKELDEANNKIELLKQENKVAKEMLESSGVEQTSGEE